MDFFYSVSYPCPTQGLVRLSFSVHHMSGPEETKFKKKTICRYGCENSTAVNRSFFVFLLEIVIDLCFFGNKYVSFPSIQNTTAGALYQVPSPGGRSVGDYSWFFKPYFHRVCIHLCFKCWTFSLSYSHNRGTPAEILNDPEPTPAFNKLHDNFMLFKITVFDCCIVIVCHSCQ